MLIVCVYLFFLREKKEISFKNFNCCYGYGGIDEEDFWWIEFWNLGFIY